MTSFIQLIGLVYTLVYFGLAMVMAPSLTTLHHTNEKQSLHLDWVDKNIDKNKNFFQFANGNWMRKNPIPAGYSRWSIFQVIQEQNNERIHQLLEEISKNKANVAGTIEQKLGDFYFSGMDVVAINKAGILPLQTEFARINNIKNIADLQTTITHLQMIGVNALFKFDQMQDFKNSRDVIGVAFQGGLGLPDRDYYLKNEPRIQHIRELYKKHIMSMFLLLGDNTTQAVHSAKTVMKIETLLAHASMPLSEQRNPHAIYHMMNVKQLNSITPHFSWNKYFANIGHSEIKNINLATPNFFKALNKQFTIISLDEWKVYLRWHLIDTYAPFLSDPFVNEDFRMDSALTGKQSLLPRWKRVVSVENEVLGFAIGKLYVEKTFAESSKKEVEEMINQIRQQLKQNLLKLSWMTDATRQAAINKLDLMETRVGYPDKWRDYSALKVERDSYAANIMRASEFLTQYELNKIGKPVDRSEWGMTPQTVNAYYNPSLNQLTIPAGILNPPFFSDEAPKAVNYGGIGSTIGHEMIHGFDDEGAQFDAEGNLHNWWTEADLKQFHVLTKCVSDQFSSYSVSGIQVKGDLVVGEALADLGGMKLAYQALHHEKETKKAEKEIEGFDVDQQFFLSAAHTWAHNIHQKAAQLMTMTNPHPLPIYRVNGTFANMPEFRQAFHINVDSPMVNKQICLGYP